MALPAAGEQRCQPPALPHGLREIHLGLHCAYKCCDQHWQPLTAAEGLNMDNA